MPRELLRQTGNLARLLRLPAPYDADIVRSAYAPRATITHRIDVFRFARQKRDAFAAHRSQIGRSGLAARAFEVLLRLPPQAFGLLFPREWFVDPALSPGIVRGDILIDPAKATVKAPNARSKLGAAADISGNRTTNGS